METFLNVLAVFSMAGLIGTGLGHVFFGLTMPILLAIGMFDGAEGGKRGE